MSFIWPPMLLSLLLLPLGVALHVRGERGRRRALAAYGSLGAEAPAAAGASRRRRQVPTAFFLLGLTVMLVALGRPQGVVSLPRVEGTVILAFDVSGSMAADDFKPTRMEAAKAAARAFVERQPSSVVVGVVAFSDSGLSVQPPTSDQATVLAAVNRLGPERGTSLAQGIDASLDAIAATEAGNPTDYYSNRSQAPTPEPTPVPSGTHAPAVIVLLTDGENNERPDPLEAAKAAADRGIRIHTVGMGSAAGTTLEVEGFRVHTQLDEGLLRQIADTTGGTYYGAEDQAQLQQVYDNLDTRLVVKPETIEVTALFAGGSMVLLLIGAAASLFWLGRAP